MLDSFKFLVVKIFIDFNLPDELNFLTYLCENLWPASTLIKKIINFSHQKIESCFLKSVVNLKP